MAERKSYEYQDDDLERYGVWVKAGPEEVVEANEEFTLSDLPIDDVPPTENNLPDAIDLEEVDTPSTPNMSLEPPDDSLEIDSFGSDDLEDPLDLEEIDFEDELVSFDDINLEEPAEEGPPDFEDELVGPPDSTIPGSDDKVGAVGLDDTSMDARERETLLQIQTELTDIKRELAELKEALHPGVSPVAFPSVEEQQPAPATDESLSFEEQTPGEDEAEAAHGLGFFEEDEDETIALTGDELDNILNTAEFTEQAGEAEEFDDEFLVGATPREESTETSDAPTETVDDDPAVNELVAMDINQELSDIDALSDDTFEEKTAGDEIYLDALDEMDGLDEATDEDFDTFATAVEKDITRGESPEAEVASTEIDEIDEIELEDDFDDENDKEEEDEEVESDGEEEIELDLDNLEVEDIDLDENDLDESDIVSEIDRIPSEEGVSVEETLEISSVEAAPDTMAQAPQAGSSIADLPADLKQEIRSVLSYMDQLLEALPDDKIEEFAQSEHFDVYKRLFEELGLET